MIIPENVQDRVDFKIKSFDGTEKKVSLRLGEGVNRISESEEIKLTIEGIDKIVNRGDILNVFGNGSPDKALSIKVLSPKQDIINTRTTEVDTKGKWKLSESINISQKKFLKHKNTKLLGKKTIFSDMADWNPAEIIGHNTNILDYSLYNLSQKNHGYSILLVYQY